jgi:DNA-directed RNA polymerase subunit RPC12/RpoP
LMEERAKLEPNAQVEVAGRCPYCSSVRTYLEKGAQQQEIRAPSGMVVYSRQEARCRACGGSFSPSGAGLGTAG